MERQILPNQFHLYQSGQFAHNRLTIGNGYQIDIFPTDKGGAAVCLRYGTPGNYRIMIYDGGTHETGNALVAHIQEHYGTSIVDDVICSHPNTDHVLGLWPVLQNLEVKALWMHRPWEYSLALNRHMEGIYRDKVMAAHFSNTVAITYALEKLAIGKDIPVLEPFQGMQIGPMTVMSPHRDWFVYTLMQEFTNPSPAKRVLSPEVDYLLRQSGIQFNDPVRPSLSESWKSETLQEFGNSSVEMESSVVLFGLIGSQGVLLSGNAGVRALSNAAAYAEYQRVLIPAHLTVAQIPNQGDCNHVSPSVLDRLIGPRLPAPAVIPRMTAFITSSQRNSGYPHQSVINALIRRGAQVAHIKTKVGNFCRTNQNDARKIEMLMFSTGL